MFPESLFLPLMAHAKHARKMEMWKVQDNMVVAGYFDCDDVGGLLQLDQNLAHALEPSSDVLNNKPTPKWDTIVATLKIHHDDYGIAEPTSESPREAWCDTIAAIYRIAKNEDDGNMLVRPPLAIKGSLDQADCSFKIYVFVRWVKHRQAPNGGQSAEEVDTQSQGSIPAVLYEFPADASEISPPQDQTSKARSAFV